MSHQSDSPRKRQDMQKRKICIVTETYPNDINGVSLMLGRLVNGLRRCGHRVRVLRPNQRSDAKIDYSDGDALFPGFKFPWYHEIKLGYPMFGRLSRIFCKENPDYIFIATEGPLG